MSEKPFDLIIAEKDNQAEDIAIALSVPKAREIIRLPTEEALNYASKIQTKHTQIQRKEDKIAKMEADYNAKGKPYAHLKGYTKLVDKKIEWEKNLFDLEMKYKLAMSKADTLTIPYYKNDDIVICACSGHLIDIKFKTNGSSSDLNFKTELKPPSPTSSSNDEQENYARLELIGEYLKKDNLGRIINACDYDREGESIFGTIMEYYIVNLNTCLRMKFSTLEYAVLKQAYQNLISFNINLFNAGKMRRWSDFVIGFNVNPILAKIYRKEITRYLTSIKIPDEAIDNIKYNNTFNIGRVKLVVLDYIHNFTKEQIKKLANIENHEADMEDIERFQIYFRDKEKRDHYIFDNEWMEEHTKFDQIDLEKEIKLIIEKVEFKDKYQKVPNYSGEEVPSFLNMTKVYQICRDLGASVDEIKRVLQYLYLQQYISYPRSKSERWEIPDDITKLNYAQNVINALENCGYPIKDYYRDSYGNEGDINHSHPCIHPLPSLTKNKVDVLKKTSPLGFLVFNRIALHTLKCFEKLPLIKRQRIHFKMSQDDIEARFRQNYVIELIEENILTFSGLENDRAIIPEIQAEEGEEYIAIIEKSVYTKCDLEKNHEEIKMIEDFDVIDFLNKNDIGTEATRDNILLELIKLQYFVSPTILLTTFLGNSLHKLGKRYVSFINIDYTLNIERELDRIESGDLAVKEFKEDIINLIKETYNKIIENEDEIKKLFLDIPYCEVHKIPMIIKAGIYGKFLQCPYYYIPEIECNQIISI